MKRLVICADDFAVHRAASEGIAGLAAQGRLGATSAMVLSPRWMEDVHLLQPLRARLDVGLHLDWTSVFAQQAGHGRSLGRMMFDALTSRMDPRQAGLHIEQQLDRFEQAWGAPPSHIDGHQHVQQFAGVREALVGAVVRRYGEARRPYLRISQAPVGLRDFKSMVMAAMGAERLRALAISAGLACAPALAGIYDFGAGPPSYAERMAAWLRQAPEATLLMCHPATAVAPDDGIGVARLAEYTHLASASFPAQLEQAGVQLVRGSLLFRSAA